MVVRRQEGYILSDMINIRGQRMTKQEERFDMLAYYKRMAGISNTFPEYHENVSNGLALLCMGLGRIPRGSSYENFARAWEVKND